MITFQDVKLGDVLTHPELPGAMLQVAEKGVHLVGVRAPSGKIVHLYPSEFEARGFEMLPVQKKPKGKQ